MYLGVSEGNHMANRRRSLPEDLKQQSNTRFSRFRLMRGRGREWLPLRREGKRNLALIMWRMRINE